MKEKSKLEEMELDNRSRSSEPKSKNKRTLVNRIRTVKFQVYN